jgi:hypothetical protein
VFLPLFAVTKIRDARERKEPVNTRSYVLGVIAGFLFIAGALFKILHWPGAGWIITISWVLIAAVFFPLIILNILKQTGNRLNNFFYTTLGVVFISLLVLVQVRDSDKDMISELALGIESLAGNVKYYEGQTEKLLDEARQDDDAETLGIMQSINAEAGEICDFIQSLKKEMVLAVRPESNAQAINEDGSIDYLETVGGEFRDIANEIMLVEGETEGSNASWLEDMLASFKEMSLSRTGNAGLESYIHENLLNFDHWPEGIPHSLEHDFAIPMIQTASKLTLIQCTVRLIEHELIKELSAGSGD